MSTVTDLEREVRILRSRLRSAEESLRRALIAEAPAVGDLIDEEVRLRGEPTWEGPYRVSGLSVHFGKVRLHVVHRRKDGTWGKRERQVWRAWRLHEPEPQEAR